MNTVEPTNAWTTPYPCPTCGTTTARTTKRIHEGIATADNLCEHGHLYTLRWLVA